MKTLMMILGFSMVASTAYADGFVCETNRGDLKIKAYNHTDAADGTRTAAVLVLSDPSVGAGRQTIARFTDVNTTLSNRGADYLADVDLRYSDSGHGGELICGTKLMYLDTVELNVDFSYNTPVGAGERVSAEVVLVKRNGEKIHRDAECVRYLKD